MICQIGLPYEALADIRDGVTGVQQKILLALNMQDKAEVR